jgi:fermentation-respiration switch protein FrsA (DUF1100 family)
MSRRQRTWPKLVVLLLLAAGLYCAERYSEQRTLYAPDPVIAQTPAKIGLPFQGVIIDSTDGVKLSGWFVPGALEATAQPRPTLLFFHGNAGNISYNLHRLRVFHEAGLDVLTMDYRGYGKSDGVPSERGLGADAMSAYFYLTEKRGVVPERLILYGESLGAAVAVELAMKVSAAGMILEAPFTSNADRVGKKWPLIPWEHILRDNYDSMPKIHKINMPVLFVHSVDDEVIPFSYSQRLYMTASEPKELLKLHGTHRDIFINSYDTYSEKVTSFVHQLMVKPLGKTPPTAAERPSAPAGQTP